MNVEEKRKPLYMKEKSGFLQVSVYHTKARGGKISAAGLWRECDSDPQTSSHLRTSGVRVPEVRECIQQSLVTDYRATSCTKLHVR